MKLFSILGLFALCTTALCKETSLKAPHKTGFPKIDNNEILNAPSRNTVTNPMNPVLPTQLAAEAYKLTFIFNNGTEPEVKTLSFNETIIYPEKVNRKGYIFAGWSPKPERMPANDLNVTAQWKSQNSGKTTLVVSIVVIVVCAFAAIGIILFVLSKKQSENSEDRERILELNQPLVGGDSAAKSHSRVVTKPEDESESKVSASITESLLTNLYLDDYSRPTLGEALLKAGLTQKQITSILNTCRNTMNYALDDEFTKEDAAAVAMYTYDLGPKAFESNPHRIINKSIAGRNYADLQRASGLLYLVMSALRKLPRVTGITLYRGVKGDVNLDEDHYHEGNVITWPAISSTSPVADEVKEALTVGSESGEAVGTLFVIEDAWGYNIQPYSLFPNEAEILIEPERQFKVISVARDDLTVIKLQMLDTPLSLPDVFGQGN